MKAILLRTGSGANQPAISIRSPKATLSGQDPGAGISFFGKTTSASSRSGLHFDIQEKRHLPSKFRRALSDSDLNRFEYTNFGRVRTLSSIFSRSFPARIQEEDDLDLQRKANEDEISVSLKWREFDLGISDRVAEILPVDEISAEETEISGGGTGKGRKIGGGGDDRSRDSDWNGDRSEIRAYYEEMLKADPLNPLLLTNYGKFLHEVERDYEKAEECYGKAILTSSGDGEVLSLYGKLIWETQRDEARAKGYFDRAVEAAPDNCYVLGSYASFMWNVENEDEEEEEEKMVGAISTPLINVF